MEIIHRAKPARMIYSHKRQNGFNIFSCLKNSQTQTHSTQIVHNEAIYILMAHPASKQQWAGRDLFHLSRPVLCYRVQHVSLSFSFRGSAQARKGTTWHVTHKVPGKQLKVCFYHKTWEIIRDSKWAPRGEMNILLGTCHRPTWRCGSCSQDIPAEPKFLYKEAFLLHLLSEQRNKLITFLYMHMAFKSPLFPLAPHLKIHSRD